MKRPILTLLIAGAAFVLVFPALKQPVENAPLGGLSEVISAKMIHPTPAPPVPQEPAKVTAAEQQVTPSKTAEEPEIRKLTLDQAEAYLLKNHRTAESLYAAYQTTGDRKYLNEAKEKFPNDPKVAMTAALISSATPEEKRQWLDTFKKSDPENALPFYLSAQDHFKQGQPDVALQEILVAQGKAHWQDYALDSSLNAEEALLSAGYSPAESKISGQASTLLPALAPLKQLGASLGELAQSYQQAGDTASAQSSLQMALALSRQLTSPLPQPLIGTLVGMAIEKQALSSMDPNAPYGGEGRTVADQLAALGQQRDEVKKLNQQFQSIFPKLPEEGMVGYVERQKTVGELSAMRWALQKYGPQ